MDRASSVAKSKPFNVFLTGNWLRIFGKNWNCWGFCPVMRLELTSSDFVVWHFAFKLHQEASVGSCVDQTPITIYRFTDKLFFKEHWRYWSNYQVTSIRKSGKFFIEILLRLLSTQTITRPSTAFTSRCFSSQTWECPGKQVQMIFELDWLLSYHPLKSLMGTTNPT